MSHKSANYLLQLSNFTRTSGERGVIAALQEKLLSGDSIKKIHEALTSVVKKKIVTPKGEKFRLYDGERDGIVIYIMHYHYGISHDIICEFYKDGNGKSISTPAVSMKYSKIAKMKKDTPKTIWLIGELRKITADLDKIVGKNIGNHKRGRGYTD